MHLYTCIIIEDEPLAAELLQEYIGQIGFLRLLCTCGNALQALDVLQKEKVDLIFLDIHLPRLKGLDFLASLNAPPAVIITTAYHDYALQGYEFNVLDYLLKPIDFGRFVKAIHKLRPAAAATPALAQETERPFLFLNADKKKVKVYPDEIIYLEGDREYVKIIMQNGSIRTKIPISKTAIITGKGDFIQVHRSFVVAKQAIVSFSASDVEVKGRSIPIGRSYKEAVLAELKAWIAGR